MRELVLVTGMVLSAFSAGDYDKRLILLTKERGKLTVFSRGAKRAGSLLRAASRPFVFGRFSLSEGREAYYLYGADITNYFDGLEKKVESACYASYFAELADYYGREGLEAGETLKLLYQSFRALLKDSLPNRLIWRIFELKIMVVNGEYTEKPPLPVSDSACYAWEYVIFSPIEKLYTFVLTEEVLTEFAQSVEKNKRAYLDRGFHSLDILSVLI